MKDDRDPGLGAAGKGAFSSSLIWMQGTVSAHYYYFLRITQFCVLQDKYQRCVSVAGSNRLLDRAEPKLAWRSHLTDCLSDLEQLSLEISDLFMFT